MEQRTTNRSKVTVEVERDLGYPNQVAVSRVLERSGALQLGDWPIPDVL
jgi:hypothetical protein